MSQLSANGKKPRSGVAWALLCEVCRQRSVARPASATQRRGHLPRRAGYRLLGAKSCGPGLLSRQNRRAWSSSSHLARGFGGHRFTHTGSFFHQAIAAAQTVSMLTAFTALEEWSTGVFRIISQPCLLSFCLSWSSKDLDPRSCFDSTSSFSDTAILLMRSSQLVGNRSLSHTQRSRPRWRQVWRGSSLKNPDVIVQMRSQRSFQKMHHTPTLKLRLLKDAPQSARLSHSRSQRSLPEMHHNQRLGRLSHSRIRTEL